MARFKFDLTRKSTWKRILSVVLATLLLAGAVFGIVKLTQFLRNEKKTVNPSWSVGGLLSTDGEFDKAEKNSIYTEEAFSAKGLEIELDFDSTVTYQVFFYDKLDNYISCTEVYEKSATIDVPLYALARIEVNPISSDDDLIDAEIKWYNKHKYSSQLTIRVDKEQSYKQKDFTRISLKDDDVFTFHSGMRVKNYYDEETLEPRYRIEPSESDVYYEWQIDRDVSCAFLLFDLKEEILEENYFIQVFVVHEDDTFENYDTLEVEKLSVDNLIEVSKGDRFIVTTDIPFNNSADMNAYFYFV